MERAQQEFVATCIAGIVPKPGYASDHDIEVVLRNGYENGADMAEVGKAVMSSLIGTETRRGIPVFKNKRLSLCKIGGKSKESFAYTMDVPGKKTCVVVKTPQRSSRSRDLLREYVLGILAVNPLRCTVPTLVYTFGVFSKDDRVYVVYEHIKGQNVRTLLNQGKLTFNRWLNVFVQMLITLEVSQRQSRLTHFDLHTDNVLVRNTSGYSVPLDDTCYSVANGADSPVIIDLGHSCGRVNNKYIGSFEHPKHGMVSYPVPGNDMYKFLVSSLNASKGGTQQKILRLFEFYGGCDPYNIQQDMSKVTTATSQYCREATFSSIGSRTPQQFLEWIFLNYPPSQVSCTPRKIYRPIQVPKIAQATQIAKAVFIAKTSTRGGCIIPAYYAFVLRKYAKVRSLPPKITAQIQALEQSYPDVSLDQRTLCKVFVLPIPSSLPTGLLDVCLTEAKKRVNTDVSELRKFCTSLSNYTQVYYTLQELHIPELNFWMTEFAQSKQYRFYTDNKVAINRILRWDETLQLALTRNRF